jgi:DNA-binding transcriptional ArsR family regulator
MEIIYRQQADRLKAIAHPFRLRILEILRQEPECVCHLSAALDRPQPYVSQQLAILRNAGVIVDERDGVNVYYQLADEAVTELVTASLGPLSVGQRSLVEGCSCPKCRPLEADAISNCAVGAVNDATDESERI